MENYYRQKMLELENFFFKNYNVIVESDSMPKKLLPDILVKIKKHLENNSIDVCEMFEDGRINSNKDEDTIINLLIEKFGDKIKKMKSRSFCDIVCIDEEYGEIPVNIKSTTTTTPDNTGKMGMFVQAFTTHELDFEKQIYSGAAMTLLKDAKKNKTLNEDKKKDYFFLVINKNNTDEIIINSILGLSVYRANINNPPFQIKWSENKTYKNRPIEETRNKMNELFYKLDKSYSWTNELCAFRFD